MSSPSAHIDPGAAFVEAIAQRTAEILLERLQAASPVPAVPAGGDLRVHPDEMYDARFLADRWFGGRIQSVHDIPEC